MNVKKEKLFEKKKCQKFYHSPLNISLYGGKNWCTRGLPYQLWVDSVNSFRLNFNDNSIDYVQLSLLGYLPWVLSTTNNNKRNDLGQRHPYASNTLKWGMFLIGIYWGYSWLIKYIFKANALLKSYVSYIEIFSIKNVPKMNYLSYIEDIFKWGYFQSEIISKILYIIYRGDLQVDASPKSYVIQMNLSIDLSIPLVWIIYVRYINGQFYSHNLKSLLVPSG